MSVTRVLAIVFSALLVLFILQNSSDEIEGVLCPLCKEDLKTHLSVKVADSIYYKFSRNQQGSWSMDSPHQEWADAGQIRNVFQYLSEHPYSQKMKNSSELDKNFSSLMYVLEVDSGVQFQVARTPALDGRLYVRRSDQKFVYMVDAAWAHLVPTAVENWLHPFPFHVEGEVQEFSLIRQGKSIWLMQKKKRQWLLSDSTVANSEQVKKFLRGLVEFYSEKRYIQKKPLSQQLPFLSIKAGAAESIQFYYSRQNGEIHVGRSDRPLKYVVNEKNFGKMMAWIEKDFR